MLKTLRQIWRSPDLRSRIGLTFGLLVFVRILTHIPLPGIDRSQLLQFLNQSENQVFGVLSLFTGGSLSNISIDMMGVGPYITGSIIVQILTKAIPSWEAMSKEDARGREKLNQYSRYLALPMAFIQGYGLLALLRSQQVVTLDNGQTIALMLLTVSATSIFVMWIGELISERGIGNGISLIIALNIVAGLPQQITNTATAVQGGNWTGLIVLIAIAVVTIVVTIIMNEAARQVPITYARRQAAPGSRLGGVDSYLPIRVNTAGVIPIIFALSFLTFPQVIARFLATAKSERLTQIAASIDQALTNQLYYGIAYFILVVVFSFFYTYIVFEPKNVADNLQKQGSFIPGVRPGSETARFLRLIITRLTTVGALFLGAIAVLPIIMQEATGISTLVIGGTSILIVVSVVVETQRQLASHLSMRQYDTVG